MDFEEAWGKVNNKTRNAARKAAKSDVYCREGTLEELASIHWDSTYLPKELGKSQHVYVACIDIENPIVIAAVLIETREGHIVYRYAASHKRFLEHQGNTYLIFYIAQLHEILGYKYMDLGGSRKAGIERFKRQFATRSYPINKPLWLQIYRKLVYQVKKLVV